jgi:hypothetical protein
MVELTILGQGPSRHNCPFESETWSSLSVVGLEEFSDAPISKAFCFDLPERKTDELKGLQVAIDRGIPIVGHGWLPKFDKTGVDFTIEPYPLKEIRERFDTYYFKNDTSYMIALALYLGYKNLLLWGVDQGGGPKEKESIYTMALPYVMYWLGVASGMGVEWSLAPDSILLRSSND